MKPEEMRIAIAEACGWTYITPTMLDGIPPNGRPADAKSIPDYLNDLNAMHEAENALMDRYENYTWILSKVVQDSRRQMVVCATASQRAEAFLKTIGKWKE